MLVAGATGYTGGMAWDATKPNGQPRRRLDVSRARREFGFEAGRPLREGIAATVAWYEEQVAARASTTVPPQDDEGGGTWPA